MQSINNEIIYYFGIIDILTNFSTKKKLEYVAKRITLGPTISAIPPSDYGERFMQFNSSIFDEI
jgi:1-phosphatidylinositol-4-phosphate 5-kinase